MSTPLARDIFKDEMYFFFEFFAASCCSGLSGFVSRYWMSVTLAVFETGNLRIHIAPKTRCQADLYLVILEPTQRVFSANV